MTPHGLLATADTLLTGRARAAVVDTAEPGLASCWPRVCAGLLRIALEHGLRHYWHARELPGTSRASMRTQLLAIGTVTDPRTAEAARQAWYGLCRAVHHHSYELPPTAAELRGWYDDVSLVLTRLSPQASP